MNIQKQEESIHFNIVMQKYIQHYFNMAHYIVKVYSYMSV